MSDTQRWDELRDRQAAGDPLSAADRAFVTTFEAEHPAQQDEANAWETMVAYLAAGRPSNRSDQAMATDVLERARAEHPPSKMRWRGAGAVLVAAAAATLVWWQTAVVPADGPDHPTSDHVQAQSLVKPGPVAPTPGDPRPAVDGLAFSDPAGLFLGGVAPVVGTQLKAARDGCFDLEGSTETIARVCASARTRLSIVQAATGRTELRLDEGRLTTTFHSERAPKGHVFSIITSVASVSAIGTIFTVEVSAEGRVLTSVEEGVVQVSQGGGRVLVKSGEERVLHETPSPQSRPARSPPPAVLQSRAEQARRSGDFGAAAGVYKQLVAAHPSSPEARVALVALGDLQLDKLGQARAALRNYDAYTKQPGPLLEEAFHGRIRALAKLGNRTEEHSAIRGYLQRFPAGFYADELRARLP